jgi:type I restriction enzyme, S subunit
VSAWPSVRFGDLFTFIRNGMNVQQDKSGRGLPITRIETIAEGVVDGSRVGFAGLAEPDCREWLLAPGDLLLSHINSVSHIGKCAIYIGAPVKLVHGMNLLCLRCDTARLLPRFATYLIRSNDFKAALLPSIKRAVNQASVSIADLRQVGVQLPPLGEQRRISDILDLADAMRAKRREAIASLLALQEASLHSVVASAGCVCRPIGRLGVVRTGGTPPSGVPGMFGGEIPFVTPGDLESGEPVVRSLTEAGAARIGTVRVGASLVCCIGKIGQVGRAIERSAFNQQINGIEWGPEVDDTYGYFALRAAKSSIRSRAASTTVPILKKSLF